MRTELLCPAGDFKIAKQVLYNGADAVYLAYNQFGARAYAKNLDLEEIEEIVKIAHVLNKKIYVVVNTLIKDTELEDVFGLIDSLYLLGVDAIIATDIAVYQHLIANYSDMECHISTQVGVKNLSDALFFQNLGANRVVLARETSLDEIEKIKSNCKIALEVFIHGALCVSYSGGCLMSSLLSLRSGNRGRCSQNCRREYTLYEDGQPISEKCFLLSMKDLNSSKAINRLVMAKVDSLKIEGRMKNLMYVTTITRHYRRLLDGLNGIDTEVDQIFHRQFTKGFLQNEDRGKVANILSSGNEGVLIGKIISCQNDRLLLDLSHYLSVGDKVKLVGKKTQFITVEKLFDLNNKAIEKGIGKVWLNINCQTNDFQTLYLMVDTSSYEVENNQKILELTGYVSGSLGEKLTVSFVFRDKYYTESSESYLTEACSRSLNKESLLKQLAKLSDTPFYLADIEAYLGDNLFIKVSEINDIRRKLIAQIYRDYLPKRSKVFLKPINFQPLARKECELIASCQTQAQFDLLRELGIKTIFYKNRSDYIDDIYPIVEDEEVLINNYGAIRHYSNKSLTSDYLFNVLNYQSVLHLLNFGFSNITLSPELSGKEIKELIINFQKHYNFYPPVDLVVYGHQRLMITKYCPLKQFALCGRCQKHSYAIHDELGSFILKPNNCQFMSILNGKALNLLNEIGELKPYISRFRLDFTIEDSAIVRKVVESAKKAFRGENVAFEDNQTRGCFKRSIL